MNQVKQEIILHGVRWARNILVEVAGNHTRGMGKDCSELLHTAISALTSFDHTMGKEHPEAPKALKAYIMNSSDKKRSPLRVLVIAETRAKAHDIFAKEYGAFLYEEGAWSCTDVIQKGSYRLLP